jgi:hypothetical protein
LSGAPEVRDRTPLAADAFADRVMAAIRREKPPTPTRTFVSAVRARSPRDAGSALWTAWHLGTVRAWSIAPGVRARSIALVLAVACALGTGSLATAAAVRVAAQPVVELLQSGAGEHGPVVNRSGGIDEQGPTELKPLAEDKQRDRDSADQGQSEGATARDAAGADQPINGETDNDKSETDDADHDDGEPDQPGVDEDADEEADSDQPDTDDAPHETADDGDSDTDESEATDEAGDAEESEDSSASDEPDAEQPGDDDDTEGGGDPAP